MKRQHAFLLMMANAVLVFALWWYDDPGDRALVSGGLLAGFVVIIALLLLARPRGFIATLGRGFAAAMIGVAATAFVGASLLVLLLTEYGPKRLSWTEYAFAIAFMVVNLPLWRVLEPDPPGNPFIAKTAGAGCGVIVTFFRAVLPRGDRQLAGACSPGDPSPTPNRAPSSPGSSASRRRIVS
jgi:hypothetical protein